MCVCMCTQCGVKRVSGAGQASYGEADVGTYCPGLPHCTPERWTDERRSGGQREGGEEGERRREAETDERR